MLLYTKKQLREHWRNQVNDLIQYCEGPSHLAKMIGLPPSNVQGWLRRGRISREGAILISSHPELKKHFTISDMRPDL